MDATFEFAINGDIMEFATYLIRTGCIVPAALFIDILTEKCQLINRHLCSTKDNLVIMASITNTIASITFYDTNLEDSEIQSVTLSNLPDLEDQLIHLWREVHDILRYYHVDDHNAELASIDTYYSNLAYDQLMQVNFML